MLAMRSTNLDSSKRRLLYGCATIALLIAVASLWLPNSWEATNSRGERVGRGISVTHIGIGAMKPLQLTWESSPSGFWLSLSRFQPFSIFVSVTLTIAAVTVARREYCQWKAANGATIVDKYQQQ